MERYDCYKRNSGMKRMTVKSINKTEELSRIFQITHH